MTDSGPEGAAGNSLGRKPQVGWNQASGEPQRGVETLSGVTFHQLLTDIFETLTGFRADSILETRGWHPWLFPSRPFRPQECVGRD